MGQHASANGGGDKLELTGAHLTFGTLSKTMVGLLARQREQSEAVALKHFNIVTDHFVRAPAIK